MNTRERVPGEVIERARLVNLISLAARIVELKREGDHQKGLCPFHKEKTPSFHVWPDHFHCYGCSAHGDAIEWLTKTENLTFIDAVAKLTDDSPQQTVRGPLRVVARNEHPAPNYSNPDLLKAREAFERAAVGHGSLVEVCLRSRGITIEVPPSIRFAPVFKFRGIGRESREVGYFPAAVVAVQSPTREIIALQATALLPDGTGKAHLPKSDQRRTLGSLGGGAVRLGKATGVLGLAEGVEDALSAMQLTGVPCWAALGGQRMYSVTIHDTVRELHIFADDDDAGRGAAERTAERWKNRRVIIRRPPAGFKDWNDCLMARQPK